MIQRIAAVIPIYEIKSYTLAHIDFMAKWMEEIIILLGNKPFTEYLNAGMVNARAEDPEKMLKERYPRVHIVRHDFDYFCGDLLNLGMDKALELGCAWITKFDDDMFVEDRQWTKFLGHLYNDDYETYLLDYANCTTVYKQDLEHGVPGKIFPVGMDPLIVKTDQRFIQNGVAIMSTGKKKVINWPDFTIHHLTGWGNRTNEEELRRCEALPGFPGWSPAPDEIKELLQ